MKALLLAGAVLATVACSTEPTAVVAHEHKLSAPEGDASTAPSGAGPVSAEGNTAGSSRAYPLDPSAGPTTSPTTTTTVEVTTTTEPAPVATTPAPRRTTTTTERPTQLAPVVHGDDFWWRLAMCESGAGASSPNVFQFMGGTAEKVGYYAGASYEAQRAMAIDWAARIHPREGTTAGWPVCWWRAGGS